ASATPDDVLQNMSRIAQTVERITSALEASVGSEEAQQNMRDTLANLAEVTEALNQTVDENRQSIRNILAGVEAVTLQGRADAIEILENVRVVTEELKRLMAGTEAGDPGARERVNSLVDRVNSATQSLEKTMSNLESTTGRLERGEGTLGRLTKDEKLIDEIEGVAENIGSYVS